MKTFKTIAASAVMAATMMAAGASSAATIYDLNVYDSSSGITGSSLGKVTVGGQGSSQLSFDVVLNPNVFFQITGSSSPQSPHDSVWFDLNKLVGGNLQTFNGNVTFAFDTPTSGAYPTGGQFTGVKADLGQGWSSGDYGLRVSDSSRGPNLNYYGGELKFTVTSKDGSLLSLAGSTHNNKTVYGAMDLRQCPGSNPTAGTCKTGPVGFSYVPQTSAVPEPATWAIMLMGFGGLGAMLRQRRSAVAMVRA